jgi:hypothetical protein
VPGRPHTYIPNSPHIQNQFSFWPGYEVEPGTAALFVTDEVDTLPKGLQEEFASIQRVDHFWTAFNGRQLKEYVVYYCRN